MYDDPAFYKFVSGAHTQDDRVQVQRHRRKASLLAQPNEEPQANRSSTGGRQKIRVNNGAWGSPPRATVNRRTLSYSDFHDIVGAALGLGSAFGGATNHKDQKDVEDGLGFSDWYETLEGKLLEVSHNKFKAFHDQLEYSESYLDSLASKTTALLNLLASLSDSFKNVDAQTTAFQKQCENLMADQQRLSRLADDVGENLQYYDHLEPITRKLNAPGAGNLSSQREADAYRSRYRLLLTRGLTLIRVHFVGVLREIAKDVSRRIADNQLNETTMSTLLYAKFRVGAAELKEVSQEIRKRAIIPTFSELSSEVEYQSLMNELYTGYSATRGKLVIPLIRRKIAEIAMAPSTSNDLVAFARSSIGYVKGICSDEYELWHEWFESEEGLYDFLESVCEPLYDYVRPRIIHENQLLKLCELCTLLQTRYTPEQDEENETLDLNQLDFSFLIQAALEDAQTRLVFRAQAILRDDIENFKPRLEDLDYPSSNRQIDSLGTKSNGPVTSGRKASLTEILKDPVIVEGIDSLSSRYRFDVEAVFQGSYPTLRKAIWLLSRIYRLVNSTVFEDLAHEIVHQTTLSLHRASAMLVPRTTPTDAQLFLLKHLLLLKQQIVAFDIEYVLPNVTFDFSGVTQTFYELRHRGGLFDPRNLWRFVGGGLIPRVVENMLDAKVELDGCLRTLINDFTIAAAACIAESVAEKSLAKKTFDPVAALAEVQLAARREVPVLRQKLNEYIEDARTKEMLVRAVHNQVVQDYETFCERWTAEQRAVGKVVSKKGKGREGDLWDGDTFAEWVGGVFGIGKVEFAGEESRSQAGSMSDGTSKDGNI